MIQAVGNNNFSTSDEINYLIFFFLPNKKSKLGYTHRRIYEFCAR
jgi:hypothetical protein